MIDTVAPQGYRFEVRLGTLSKADEEKANLGRRPARLRISSVASTGTPIARTYIQEEGKADRLEHG